MEFTALGSGSGGNAFAVRSPEDDSTLLIDAGFSCRELCERLAVARIAPESVRALLLTHDHADHVAGCRVFCDKLRIPLFAGGRVLESNYDPAMLEASSRPLQLKRRIRGRRGHLGNDDVTRALPRSDRRDDAHVDVGAREPGVQRLLAGPRSCARRADRIEPLRHLSGRGDAKCRPAHVPPFPWGRSWRGLNRSGRTAGSAVRESRIGARCPNAKHVQSETK